MTTKEAVDVGERLFQLRDARGWSQEKVAEMGGLGRSAVILTETGQTRPRPSTLRKMARAFGLSVDEFLYGELPNEKAAKEHAGVT